MKKIFTYLLAAFVLASCGTDKASNKEEATQEEQYNYLDHVLAIKAVEFLAPLPEESLNENNPLTQEKVALGKMLYYDKRLSKDGNISCNSCHNLQTYGVDNKPFSLGDAGDLGGRNSPTVLNASFHASQFWDGRAKDVEEQAGMPILNPVEMAIPSEEFLVNRLSGINEYQKAFKLAFPEEENALTYENIARAIGAFERTLITPSRFDEFVHGDYNALTMEEKEGLKLFINTGCTQCHNGSVIGGGMLQKFPVYGSYEDYIKGNVDYGRYDVTEGEIDRYMFKVPSLRNVEKTAPYFHNGEYKDLNNVVRVMAKAQLNKELQDEEVEAIVAFLGSLTGDVPVHALQ